MKERLCIFLEHLGIGQNKFEENVGLSRGFVNKLTGNFTIKTLDKILAKYPELNPEWLKTGEGEMLRNNINKVNGNGNTSVAGNGNQVMMTNMSEMIELQKGYQEMLKTQLSESQSQINRLITIIEQLHNGRQ